MDFAYKQSKDIYPRFLIVNPRVGADTTVEVSYCMIYVDTMTEPVTRTTEQATRVSRNRHVNRCTRERYETWLGLACSSAVVVYLIVFAKLSLG